MSQHDKRLQAIINDLNSVSCFLLWERTHAEVALENGDKAYKETLDNDSTSVVAKEIGLETHALRNFIQNRTHAMNTISESIAKLQDIDIQPL